MGILVIYDDTCSKSEVIEDVIGSRGFADVVVKRQNLRSKFENTVRKIYPEAEFQMISSIYEYNALAENIINNYEESARVLHFFSNFVISEEEQVLLSFKRLLFIDENYKMCDGNSIIGIMSPSISAYTEFLKKINKDGAHSTLQSAKMIEQSIPVKGAVDIGRIENFIQCITGNFDARYFNSLQGDEYTIVKSSGNKKKIKAEYTFYHLLPEDMQFWFVEPFHYREDHEKASYTMERLHMTDLAIKWVHGSIDEEEFEVILDKYFYFFNHRHCCEITKEEYQKIADALYVDKVVDRIQELKELKEFENMSKLLSLNGEKSIDGLLNLYLSLKKKIEAGVKKKYISVIGHGDPCFANTMYNKSTRTLKFIDPKGALKEEELWTNPYYDIAKLSHSICGRYDFFNNGLFDININNEFAIELCIEFDNRKFIEIFRRKLEENGYDYWLVRLYEASLFLSMLPLHIDNPHKVYGFILNARNILKEIEENV